LTAAAIPLGRLLIDRGLIGTEDLDRALELQRERGDKLGRILVDMGYLAQRDLLAALSEQLGLPIAQLAAPPTGPEIEGMSPRFLRQSLVFPVGIDGRSLTLAMADPLDFDATEEIEMSTGCNVDALVGRVGEIGDAVRRHYRGVITKMIPRRPVFGSALPTGTPAARPPEPTTQRHHQVADEAPPEVAVRALVDLLVERGVIDRETWQEAVRRLVKERAGE